MAQDLSALRLKFIEETEEALTEALGGAWPPSPASCSKPRKSESDLVPQIHRPPMRVSSESRTVENARC